MGSVLLFYRRSSLVLSAVKFQEIIFTLPFAYSGMLLASDGLPKFHDFLWVTIAMIGARNFGMSANRILDREIDSINPRTKGRHLPMGILKASDLTVLALVFLVVFFVAAYQLNILALTLAPVAALYLCACPLAKRFTWLSNMALGFALSIAPSGAWIGVTGNLSWEPILLSASVMFWACSFDILYHVPDHDFYLKEALYSIPQHFGIEFSFRLARVLDSLAIVCLIILGLGMEIQYPYFIGCGLSLGVLVYKHVYILIRGRSAIGTSFFKINSVISIVMLIAILSAVLMD